ncbi:endolytic transglycosylase MltG, partial [Streptococcus pneumoniae]|uniref:endolytic transglycosylase MltG n=1 Tax=Streptococcus pneumoniae TaxID=1313 RepID=UPI00135DCE95
TVEQVAAVMAEKFYRFDAQEFITLAYPFEGYLFPETYFFLPNVQAPEVLETMRAMFTAKVQPLMVDAATGEPLTVEE